MVFSSLSVRSIVILVIRMLLFFGIIVSYLSDRNLVLIMSIIALLVTFVPFLLHRLFRVTIPGEFEIIVLFFLYGLLVFAEIRGYYVGSLWFSMILTFSEGLLLGFAGLSFVYALEDEEVLELSPLIILLCTFCFAFSAGALWELFEFFLDTVFGFGLQYGKLPDTMLDLFLIAIASLFTAELGCYHFLRGKRSIFSTVLFRIFKRNSRFLRGNRRRGYVVRNLHRMVKSGEGPLVEFKSTLRKNLYTQKHDKKIEHSVLKTIAGFLNTKGGTLLVGVTDDGTLQGIASDDFSSHDKLRLFLTGLLRSYLGNHFLSYVSFEIITVDGVDILKIVCTPSRKRVFLQWEGKEEFYVRHGASTLQLEGSALLDYVSHRFS